MYFLVCNDFPSYNIFFRGLSQLKCIFQVVYVFSQYNVFFQVPLMYIPGIIPGTQWINIHFTIYTVLLIMLFIGDPFHHYLTSPYMIRTLLFRKGGSSFLWNLMLTCPGHVVDDFSVWEDGSMPVVPSYPTASGLDEDKVYSLCNQV